MKRTPAMLRDVAARTQPRGGADTETGRSKLWLAILVALFLHAPVTPYLGYLPWLARMLEGPGEDWDYADGEVVIPILLEEEPIVEPSAAAGGEPQIEEAEVAASEGEGGESASKPAPSSEPEPLDAGLPDAAPDAGVDDQGDDEADAGDGGSGEAEGEEADPASEDPLDAGADAEAPALADAEGLGDGGDSGVEDSLGLTGDLAKAIRGKPNIVLVLWFDAIREHPTGRALSEILQCEPQWREFLGETTDPVRDFEALMVTGPRFSDSSKITVAILHKLPESRIEEMIGGLVERSGEGGAWLDAGVGELVAKAHADRAERVVFTHPRDMVFITPPEGYEQIRALKQPFSLPSGEGRAISMTLANPWRPMRAFRVRAPETLTELRVDIVVTNDGGATIRAELDDLDAETAEASAKILTEELARSPVAPFWGNREFTANGSQITGTVRLSRLTSALVLGFVRAAACPSE